MKSLRLAMKSVLPILEAIVSMPVFPAQWIVPLPKGLTLKEAMIIGTAGFTAALSVQRLEENNISPEKGKSACHGCNRWRW